jgi:hypothetical protein
LYWPIWQCKATTRSPAVASRIHETLDTFLALQRQAKGHRGGELDLALRGWLELP